MLLKLLFPSHVHNIGWVYSFGSLSESPEPSAFPAWGEGSSFKVWFHLVTQLTLNWWCELNLLITLRSFGNLVDTLTHNSSVQHYVA